MGFKKSKQPAAKATLEQLEPRILYSADPFGIATDIGSHDTHDSESELNKDYEQTLALLASSLNDEDNTTVVDYELTENPNAQELLIVDSSVPDYQDLINSVLEQRGEDKPIDVVLLDSSGDGINQITDILTDYQNLDAVHIISHGEDGELHLADTTLNANSFQSHLSQISSWGNALTSAGDLLFYGCDLAATSEGESLANAIAETTGADVAASDDLTGNQLLGGDWELEYTTGEIEADELIQSEVQWGHTLGAPTNLSSGIELNSDGGNDAYLYADDGGAILGGLDSLTYETAFTLNDTETHYLVSYATPSDNNEFLLALNNDGSLSVYLAGSSVTNLTGIDYDSLKDGQQHHFAFTWDNSQGNWEVYVDGAITDSGTGLATGQTIDGSAGTGELVIGQEQDSVLGGFVSDQNLRGTIHDVRIWDEHRSGSEIELNHQHKLDVTPSEAANMGLVANWHMDGFNGSNEVVDIVSANNLNIGHASGAGFITSTPVEDLHIAENASNGDIVGYVTASDPDVNNDIVKDGTFTKQSITGDYVLYTAGQQFGDWTVRTGNVDLINTLTEDSPLGGHSVGLNGTTTGGIYQTLETEIGKEYQVVFAYSGNWNYTGEAIKDFRVSAAGSSVDVSVKQLPGWSANNMQWRHGMLTFTATSTTTDLDFLSLDGNYGSAAVVADVQVTEIPEDVTAILNSDPSLTYDAGTNKFYKLINGSYNFWDSQNGAIANTLNGVNGQLATIRSDYENEVIKDVASGASRIWLGGSDASYEGWWRWQDGYQNDDTFSYSNWAYGQPDNGGLFGFLTGYEHYAMMDIASGTWQDQDSGIFDNSSYVVEWDATEVLAENHFTYSLTDNAGGRFAIDSATGEVTIADSGLLDYNANTSHNVTVQVTDPSGNSYNEVMTITIDKAPSLSSGIELNTDGGNDAYLYADDGGAILGGLSSLTYETFFELNDEDRHFLVSYSGGGSNHNEFLVSLEADGTLEVHITGSKITASGIDYNSLKDDQQHHFAVSWDNTSGDWAIYVDGALTDSGTGIAIGQTIEGSVGTGELVIGQEQDSLGGGFVAAETFRGTVYDVRIWDEFRSRADIELNYQNKLDVTSAQASGMGLIANWQMKGFNESNQVIDIVSGNNLNVGHATGSGFIASTPVEDLHISESTNDGATVGYVIPSDPEVNNDLVLDGTFNQANISGSYVTYSAGQQFGEWTVRSGNVDLKNTWNEDSPLGGRSVDLNGSTTGGIYQTLDTEIGKEYQVVFAFSGNFDGSSSLDFRVSAAGSSIDIEARELPGWSTSDMKWRHGVLTFTATSTTTDLDFLSLEGGSVGAIIADVQATELPEDVSVILDSDPSLTYDAGTNKFYKFVNSWQNFGSASSNSIGTTVNGVAGQLATIRSDYENDIVRSLAGYSGDLWLGGTDLSSEGTWRWRDGGSDDDVFSYTNWASGNPDNGGLFGWLTGYDDYAVMNAGNGQWVDVQSGHSARYVIEWDADEVLTNLQNTFSFNLTDDAGGRFAINSTTGEITVADSSLLDYETSTSHNITVEVTDISGGVKTQQMTITVDNESEAIQNLPGAQTVHENEVLTFTGSNAVTISDSVATNNAVMQVELTVNDGILTLSQTTGLTFVEGSNGSSTFVINGTESDINAALDGMTFTHDPGYTGNVTLGMTTSLGADLEGHYTFEGGNANDQSAGTIQNGSFYGNATTTNDTERGTVLSLDGNGDGVQINSTFGNPSQVTLAAWVNLTSLDSSGSEIISLGDNVVLRANDTSVFVAHRQTGTWDSYYSEEAIDGTGWRHVAATLDDINNTYAIYIDGEVVLSGTLSNNIVYDQGTQTFIGKHANGGSVFDFGGKIDDARIYTRALSGDEIAGLANDETTTTGNVSIYINAEPDFSGDDTGSVTEDVDPDVDTLLETSGTLTVTDPNSGESSMQAETVTGSYGDLTIDTAGNWTYAADNTQAAIQNLAAGETLNDVITVTSFDGTTHDITITINGADDAAVVGGDTSGTVSEDGTLTDNGSMTIYDPDISDNPVSWNDVSSTAGDNGYGNFEMTSGTWTYTLNNSHPSVQALDAGESMTDTFTFTATDGTTQLVTVTINGNEDAPVLGGDTAGTVSEDGTLTDNGTLTITDVDSNDNPVSWNNVSSTAGDNGYGSFEMTGNTWTYTLNNSHASVQALDAGESMTDTFTFTASDGSTQLVTVTINGNEDASILGGDTAGTVSEDGTLTDNGTLTITDVDSNDNPVSWNNVSSTAGDNGYGTFEMTGNTWTYTLNNSHASVQALDAGESLNDTFTFTASDGSTQLVTVTINGNEDASILGGDTAGTVGEDGTLTDNGTLTITDVDTSDNPVSWNNQSSTAGDNGYGNFEMTGNTWTYTLNNSHPSVQALDAGESLNDTFTFTASDGSTQLVIVTINGNEDAAVLGGDTAGTVSEDGTLTDNGTLTITDTDTSDNPVSWNNQSSTAGDNGYGTFEMTGNTWTYTLNNSHPSVQALDVGESLNDTYTFTASDGSTQLVTVTINGAEDAPTVDNQIPDQNATEDSPFSFTFASNAFGDLDTSDTLTYSAQLSGGGSLPSWLNFNAGSRTFSGTPLNDDVGTISIEVIADDGTSTISDVFDLTVINTNDTPTIGGDDTGSVTEDVDPDVDTLLETSGTLTIVDVDVGESSFQAGTINGTYGDLTIDTAGNWNYEADNTQAAIQNLDVGESLNDVITVTAFDGTTHDVTITINGTEDAPVLGGDTAGTVSEDGTLTDNGTLTITDTDTSDNPVSWNDVSSTAGDNGYGNFEMTGNTWTYTLNNSHASVQALDAGESLTDTFTFTASDGSTQLVTVTINGNEDAPVLGGDTAGTVSEDGTLTDNGTLTITDTDTSDNPVSWNDVSSTAGDNGYGNFEMTGNTWTYTLNNSHPSVQALDAGESLTDTYTFTASDGSTELVTVTINGNEDAAVLGGDTAGTVSEDGTLTDNGTLTITDTDTSDNPVSWNDVSSTAGDNGYGNFEMTGNTWTYTLNNSHPSVQALDAGESMTDTYTFTASDGSTQLVTVTINGNEDAPVLGGDTAGTVSEDGTLTDNGTLTITDTDTSDNPVSWNDVSSTAGDNGYGNFEMTGNTWTYTLNNSHPSVQALDAGESLTDTFTFTASDGSTELVTVTINGNEDTAVLGGDTAGTVSEDGTLTDNGTLTITDTDTSDNPVSWNDVSSTAGDNGYGNFEMTGNTWTYTLNNSHPSVQALDAGESMTDTYTFTASDGSTQLVTVTINGNEDAAVLGGDTAGTVSEDGTLTDNGTLTITDTDTSDNPVSWNDVSSTAGDNGYGNFEISGNTWTYSLNNSHASVQALDAGESLTDTFTFTASDGSTQLVTVTINGNEDAPVLGGDIAGAVGEDDTLTDNGTLTITDTDTSDNPVSWNDVSSTEGDNGYGNFEMTGNAWNYTLDNEHPDVQALDASETLTDTFTFTATDGSTQMVTVTINGDEDAPVMGGETEGAVAKGGSTFYLGSLTISDTDTSDNPVSWDDVSTTEGDNGYGTFQMINNTWFYMLNDDHPSVSALLSGESLTDSMTFTASDGSTQTVTITITQIYNLPEQEERDFTESSQEESTQPDEEDNETTEESNNDPVSEEKPEEEQTEKENDAILTSRILTELIQNDGEPDYFTNTNDIEDKRISNFKGDLSSVNLDSSINLLNLRLPELSSTVVEQFDSNSNEHTYKVNLELDRLTQDLEDIEEQSKEQQAMEAQAALGVALSFSAGFVSYLLRAGSLISSMFTVLPIWKGIDPLPIVNKEKENEAELDSTDPDNLENNEDTTDSVTKENRKIENMFSNKDNE